MPTLCSQLTGRGAERFGTKKLASANCLYRLAAYGQFRLVLKGRENIYWEHRLPFPTLVLRPSEAGLRALDMSSAMSYAIPYNKQMANPSAKGVRKMELALYSTF
jgi:hypothetical protein